MRDYGTISPQFWLGKTGKVLRDKPEAQLAALYLMTSPHASAIGIFYCPVLYIAHETGSPFEGASKGLIDLVDVGFCLFDEDTDEVFVINMARHQIGESLAPKDKRVAWVNKTLEKVMSARLRKEFIALYSVAYNLSKPTDFPPENASPFEAPSKPLRSQEQEQEQEQEQRTSVEEVGNAVGAAFADANKKTGPEPSPDPNPKPPSTKKTRPRSQIQDSFYPDFTGLAKADSKGVDVAIELPKFCDWHKSKGSLMADWQAAWRTWVSNAKPPAQNAQQRETFRERDARLAREQMEKFLPAIAAKSTTSMHTIDVLVSQPLGVTQ